MSDKLNIVLIMTDQQRADHLGSAGHPVLQTPCLDYLAGSGARFKNAYTECPVCIPARRTLMSGQKPATHGIVGYKDAPLAGPTMASVLQDGGYQTALCGKLHLWPLRCRYGFEHFQWADGPGGGKAETNSDYMRELRRNGHTDAWQHMAHGVGGESCIVRSWHMDESLHVANWATSKAIDFLETRDPTRPFFLKLSYFHPHPPITPPPFYLDRYMQMADDLPAPIEATWDRQFNERGTGQNWRSFRQYLPKQLQKQYQAAYCAAINHIDDQIQRLLQTMQQLPGIDLENTLFLFVSDHGEMLGDHQRHRKCTFHEGSIRVPFLIKPPAKWGIKQGQVIDDVVGLADVMPTILDAAGLDIPESVDGASLLPTLKGQSLNRDWFHGEINSMPTINSGMQYVTNGKFKYVWLPARGQARAFDLVNDPCEQTDVIDDANYNKQIHNAQNFLIDQLANRPEGFVKDGSLIKLEGPTTDDLSVFSN